MLARPSETITAAVGSIIGAAAAIAVAYGARIPDGVQAGAIVIVSWIAAAVTWYTARRQRAGSKTSGPDGKVG